MVGRCPGASVCVGRLVEARPVLGAGGVGPFRPIDQSYVSGWFTSGARVRVCVSTPTCRSHCSIDSSARGPHMPGVSVSPERSSTHVAPRSHRCRRRARSSGEEIDLLNQK